LATRKWLLGVLLLAICLFVPQRSARAIPRISAYFYGTVKVNGANVPTSTVVSAWINGVRADRGTETYLDEHGNSAYFLEVPGDDPETGEKEGASPGDVITFKIGDLSATPDPNRTIVWAEAAYEEVNLTAVDDSPTATPTPSPTGATNTPTVTATPTLTATPTATGTWTTTPTPTWTLTVTPTAGTPTATPTLKTVTITQIEDTFLDRTYHDVNYYTSGFLQMYSSLEGGTDQRPVFQFDLSQIPIGSQVTAATLNLFTYPPGSNTVSQTVSAYALRRAWNPREATWDQAASGVPWATGGADMPGVDRGTVAYDSVVVSDPNWRPYQWNITALVAEWVLDPLSNHGLIMLATTNGLAKQRFCSIDWVQPDFRPSLVVTYRPSTFTPTPTATTGPSPTGTATATVAPTVGTKLFAPSQDAYINEYYPETNYGADWSLRIKNDNERSLVRFDLSSIPSSAIVTDATLRLFAYRRQGSASTPLMGAYPLKRAWSEGSVTWRQAAADQPWGLAGANDLVADREGTAVASTPLTTVPDWYALSVTSAVQSWVTDPASNYGFILINLESAAEFIFYSQNYPVNAGLRPQLEVTYYVPLPTATPTHTPTATATPTQTNTPTATPTATATATATPNVGTIAGLVWEDQNRDGFPDPGEPPVAEALIKLYNRHNFEIARHRTQEDGRFAFPGLTPNDPLDLTDYYTVIETDPPGYTSTTDNTFIVRVSANLTTTVAFGDIPLLTATPTTSPTTTVTPTGTLSPQPTATNTLTPTATKPLRAVYLPLILRDHTEGR